jgi:hypothetical protein
MDGPTKVMRLRAPDSRLDTKLVGGEHGIDMDADNEVVMAAWVLTDRDLACWNPGLLRTPRTTDGRLLEISTRLRDRFWTLSIEPGCTAIIIYAGPLLSSRNISDKTPECHCKQ